MQCPRCRHENPARAKFCLECGQRLARTCAACGTELPETAKFCAECGTPIYATTPNEPRQYGIRVGTVRQRAELKPQRQGWFRSALDWALNIESLPRFPKDQTR